MRRSIKRNGLEYLPSDYLIGHVNAYRLGKQIFVSPAIFYFLNDDDDVTRDTILHQVEIVDLDSMIDDEILRAITGSSRIYRR